MTGWLWVYIVTSGQPMQYWRTTVRTGRLSGWRWHLAGSVSLSTSARCLCRDVCRGEITRTSKEPMINWCHEMISTTACCCDAFTAGHKSTRSPMYLIHYNDIVISDLTLSETKMFLLLLTAILHWLHLPSSVVRPSRNIGGKGMQLPCPGHPTHLTECRRSCLATSNVILHL